MPEPYVGEIRMFAGNFAPERLDVLRGTDSPHFRERRALPVDRDDLRRRRPGDVQPAESRQPRPHPHGHGS